MVVEIKPIITLKVAKFHIGRPNRQHVGITTVKLGKWEKF